MSSAFWRRSFTQAQAINALAWFALAAIVATMVFLVASDVRETEEEMTLLTASSLMAVEADLSNDRTKAQIVGDAIDIAAQQVSRDHLDRIISACKFSDKWTTGLTREASIITLQDTMRQQCDTVLDHAAAGRLTASTYQQSLAPVAAAENVAAQIRADRLDQAREQAREDRIRQALAARTN